jgi:hypothetical protein
LYVSVAKKTKSLSYRSVLHARVLLVFKLERKIYCEASEKSFFVGNHIVSLRDNYDSGVWETSDPLAEFAIVVQVTAYPATAMSVWIYVASLIKRI